MLEILLIRHGQTDWNRDRRIMGRKPIPLNIQGRRESEAIGRALREIQIQAIFTSPVERAVQTARLIARGRKLKLEMVPEVAEIDYGDWIGKTFDEVTEDEAYRVYHATPKLAHPPGGEKMVDVHRRAVNFIEALRKRHEAGRIVVVSHADVIKIVVTHYLGLDLNDLLRLRIDNCSVSLLWFNGSRHRVMAVNCPPSPEGLFLSPPRTGKAGCFGSKRGENPDSPPRSPHRGNISPPGRRNVTDKGFKTDQK
jgi:broad specificity phosphatase PhoE